MMKLYSGAEFHLSTRDKVYVETSFQAWYHGVSGHPLVLDNNYAVHIHQWFTSSMKTIA
jgi:hypothetical protein